MHEDNGFLTYVKSFHVSGLGFIGECCQLITEADNTVLAEIIEGQDYIYISQTLDVMGEKVVNWSNDYSSPHELDGIMMAMAEFIGKKEKLFQEKLGQLRQFATDYVAKHTEGD